MAFRQFRRNVLAIGPEYENMSPRADKTDMRSDTSFH
jgi:hypothetical protein